MILKGSKALEYWSDQLGFAMPRKCRDIDYLGTFDEIRAFLIDLKPDRMGNIDEHTIFAFKGDQIYEFEIAWEGTSGADLLEMYPDQKVLPLEALFVMKHSHRYKKDCPHFYKTMADWRFLREKCLEFNAFWDPRLIPWLKKREKETYTNKTPKLNQSKKDFFNESGELKYTWDHDSIHESVKHLEHPAYWYFKEDKAEVMCSKQKFLDCDHQTKLYSGLEETYVLAIERSQVPFPGTNPRKSFNIAAAKICSSISSGWWREFIYEYFNEWSALYSDSYVERFQDGIRNGIVKPFKRESVEQAA